VSSPGAIRIGDVELTPLLDGAQDLGGPIEESFPSVPKDAWPGINAEHPRVLSPAGTWRLHVRCNLVRLPGRTILVDTGVGFVFSPSWFGASGRLLEELSAIGVDSDEIDTVVVTHVHDDHIGGTVTAERRIAFPNARFVIQRADLEWVREWAEREEEDRVLFDALLRPLEEAGALDLVDGDRTLGAGVRLRYLPGHTPGHQIVDIEADGRRVVISGDTFNHPAQIGSPDWFAGSDDDPERANASRRTLLADVTDTDAILAPSHFAAPFGRIETGTDGRTVWAGTDSFEPAK
jgi:glyoxylase-like metal-dependent hydrolase (beta-lactamase superfamily II)